MHFSFLLKAKNCRCCKRYWCSQKYNNPSLLRKSQKNWLWSPWQTL